MATDRDDETSKRGSDRKSALQDKKDSRPRPDRPTPSDDATLAERDEGAHAEFSTAPSSFDDPPPPADERPEGDTEDEERED